MDRPDIYRLFGCWPETESSWSESLGELHQDYILRYIEAEQQKEAAIIEQFLSRRG
jgi:hypothetical protein